MITDWKEFPHAPEAGTEVCPVEDLPVLGTISFDIDGFPLLLVQRPSGLTAFVNACPHQFLPLDHRSASILSKDGTTLRCSNHDAAFSAQTGTGLGGLGVGCVLIPVPVRARAEDRRIIIG